MGVVYRLGCGMWVWCMDLGMVCGCGSVVPEAISEKLRAMQ